MLITTAASLISLQTVGFYYLGEFEVKFSCRKLNWKDKMRYPNFQGLDVCFQIKLQNAFLSYP